MTTIPTTSTPYHVDANFDNAASATQTVTLHIKPFWYKEKLTVQKNIHMVTNGPGTVRIGG